MEKAWLYAAVGGILPMIFWIFFWFREDTEKPEPKPLILETFILGIISAFVALLAQSFIHQLNLRSLDQTILFSFVEEFLKFFSVFAVALGTVWADERVDPMLYMIVAALGFSAVENTYYIVELITHSDYLKILIDGSYRFIGATLLHTTTSAIIGFFISMVFFRRRIIRVSFAFLGLFFATIIHTIFNLLVSSQNVFYNKLGFFGAWGGIVLIMFLFEYIHSKKRKIKVELPKDENEDLFRKVCF